MANVIEVVGKMSVSFPIGREIWVNVLEVVGKMSVSFPNMVRN